MKNIILVVILFCIKISALPSCSSCLPLIVALEFIQFDEIVNYQLNENGVELNVEFDIQSEIADNAYLLLRLEKKYPDNHLEGFNDSLIIDGFFVRSYYLTDDYCLDDIGESNDYPIFLKKKFLKKGINKESVSILFQRNISSIAEFVYVDALVLRYNDVIKSKVEEYTFQSLNHFRPETYLKTFPDSTFASYVFSEFDFLRSISLLSGELPKFKQCGEYYVPSYYNSDRIRFSLKSTTGALKNQ